MNCHFSWAVLPGTRLVETMAPAFTIGLESPAALRSTAMTELNGSPVLFTPSFSRASTSSMASTHRRELLVGLAHQSLDHLPVG